MNIFSRRHRRLILFMLPVLITLCGLLVVSYANRGSENGHRLNSKGKSFLRNLNSESDLIVWGRVSSVRVGNEDKTVFTYVSIEPYEVIKGTPTSPIIVRQLGGGLRNKPGVISHIPLPSWQEGEEVLLLLQQLEGSNYYISGASGKFTASWTDGQAVLEISPSVRNTIIPKEQLPDGPYSKEEVLDYMRGLGRRF